MSRALPWILATLAYLCGALVFLWPLPTAFATHVWGDRFDAWTTLWLMDHVHRALVAGTLEPVTTDILFPVGYNLWSFGHAALQLVGVGFMLAGVPLVTAYNLLLVLALVTSALGGHLLGRELSGSHLGGAAAGVVFATSPYLYGEGAAGCIELVAAGLVPAYAWSLVRVVRAPGLASAAGSAAILALVGPFNWYYTLFAGMLGLGFLAWRLLAGEWRASAWIAGAMLVAAAANAPLIPMVRRETPERPMLDAALLEDAAAWEERQRFANGTLPLALVDDDLLVASDAMQVLENATTIESLVAGRFTVNPLESTPGALAFGAALVGLFLGRRAGLGWAGIAVGATVLTLGPYLRLVATPPLHEDAFPLPYYYAYNLVPFFAKAYRPYRIAVVTLTCCAALAAVAWAHLPRSPAVRVAVPVLLGLVGWTQPLWAGERPAERALADATIPELYGELAELPRGGVIELPLQYLPVTVPNARFQYHQVRHHQPTLNCNQLIRRTDLAAFRDYVLGSTLLSTFVDLARREPPLVVRAADVARAWDDGFRYVVLHTAVLADDVDLAGEAVAADLVLQPAVHLLESLFGDPILADERHRVYGVRPPEDPSRVYTFAAVEAVDLPVDGIRLGLPTRLVPDAEVTLWAGGGREFSLWARGEGELRLRVGERVQAWPLAPDEWRWVQAPLDGAMSVALLGGPEGFSARLARAQVLR